MFLSRFFFVATEIWWEHIFLSQNLIQMKSDTMFLNETDDYVKST